jgi:(2Fe-2S) ferredoxin
LVRNVTEDDVTDIVEQHFENGEKVDRLSSSTDIADHYRCIVVRLAA